MNQSAVSNAFAFQDLESQSRLLINQRFNQFFDGQISAQSLLSGIRHLNPLEVWSLCFHYANQMTLSADLRIFFNDPSWASARSVLDVGCGTGDLIKALQAYFPEKRYVGVDVNSDFIDLAKRESGSDCLFKTQNILEMERTNEVFDYIILRRVAQHIAEPSLLLKKLKGICGPNTKVMFMEPVDSLKIYKPELVSLKTAFIELNRRMNRDGHDRKIISRMQQSVVEHGFQTVSHGCELAATVNQEDKEAFFANYILSALAMELGWKIEIDWPSYLNELEAWFRNKGSYAQVGIEFLQISPGIEGSRL